MKKISNKLKYLIFSLVIVFAGLASSTASADTYIYNCSATNGGGTVTSEVNITPGSAPYVFGPNASFNATGQITTSNCTVNQVSLTARNNFSADGYLISPTTIGSSDTVPFLPASLPFTTPANACSSPFPGICPFRVYFITGVEEDVPGPGTFSYAHATAGPVQGGTNNSNVWCDATISSPSSEMIDIRFHWIMYNSGIPVNDGYDTCTVITDPITGNGTTYPGKEFFAASTSNMEVEHVDTCYYNATAPVTAIPPC